MDIPSDLPPMTIDNYQENTTLRPFCVDYFKTLLFSHQLLSPLVSVHPDISSFSRGLIPILSCCLVMLVSTFMTEVLDPKYSIAASLISGIIIMRIGEFLLFHPLRFKSNGVKLYLAFCILLTIALQITACVVFNYDEYQAIFIIVGSFFIVEFFAYSLINHMIHTIAARSKVRNGEEPEASNCFNKKYPDPNVLTIISDSAIRR